MPRIRAENIEAHKALTRREILSATHQLLVESGSADLSLSEIAHVAGIGRTTLYEYFRDKEDLIASLVEERLPELVADLIDGVDSSMPVDSRLVDLTEATLRFLITDEVLGLILHRELPRLSPDTQERIRVAHSDLSKSMGMLYQQGVAEGTFRKMPPDLAGRFMYDVVMSAARALIAASDPTARFEEVSEAMSGFLLGGLGAR